MSCVLFVFSSPYLLYGTEISNVKFYFFDLPARFLLLRMDLVP